MSVLVKISATHKAIKYAEQNVDNPDSLEGLPLQVLLWAGIGLGLKESKATGGRNKGKAWKKKIIATWEESNKKSITTFAKKFFRDHGGGYDENGIKTGKAPAIRTIEQHSVPVI